MCVQINIIHYLVFFIRAYKNHFKLIYFFKEKSERT